MTDQAEEITRLEAERDNLKASNACAARDMIKMAEEKRLLGVRVMEERSLRFQAENQREVADERAARLRGALEGARELLLEHRICTCSECSRPLQAWIVEADAALRGEGEGG